MVANSTAIRVFVMDESSAFRGMLATHIQDKRLVEIVGSVHNVDAAAHWFESHEADIALLQEHDDDAYRHMLASLKQHHQLRIVTLQSSSEVTANAGAMIGQHKRGIVGELCRPNLRDAEMKAHFFTQLDVLIAQLFNHGADATPSSALVPYPDVSFPSRMPKVLAIGSSTGGPQALVEFFRAVGTRLAHLPIVITQHMPPHFTTILAGHIQDACGQPTIVPENDTPLEGGHIYIAPGDYHMRVHEVAGVPTLRLHQDAPVNFCRPAVDVMVTSMIPIYGDAMLVLILTGMGQDGQASAVAAREKGATIVAQDEASSVVWGMPGAVAKAGVCSAILPLDKLPEYVLKACGKGAIS